jgi:hypothetical protein
MPQGITVLPMNRPSQRSATDIIHSMARKSKSFGEHAATE